MDHLPWYVSVVFIATFLIGLCLFSIAAKKSKLILAVVFVVTAAQTALSLGGFFKDPANLTVRFPVLVMPLFIFFIALFIVPKGRTLIDFMDIRFLTILHVIRIGVEIVLFWLFLNKAIPRAMTFEGRNFDVLSGLTAPVVYYFAFVNPKIGKWGLIVWNVACMILLINVVSNAFLSLPGRFETFGFERPTIAIGYFPFALLPGVLVPVVLFSNAAAILQLLRRNSITIEKNKQ